MSTNPKRVPGPGWPTSLPEADIDVWSEIVPRGQRFVLIVLQWLQEPRPAELEPHQPDPKPRLNVRPIRSYWKRRTLDLDWRDMRIRASFDKLIRYAVVDLEASTLEYLA